MRRETQGLATTTLCLLVVWIATPLLSVAHAALEEHRYCVDHERLEEASESHSRAPGAKGSAQANVSHAHSDELPTEHVDCAFDEDFTRAAPDRFLPYPLATTSPCFLLPAPLRAVLPAESIPLLSIAPKSSPPIV